MSTSSLNPEDVYQAISNLFTGHSELQEDPSRRLQLYGSAPVFDSPHKLAVSASASIGAFALAVEKYWHMATGQRQTISIDWMQAASALNPGHFQSQNGYNLPALSLLTELKADFYRTADDRWFFPIGSYPHLRDGVLSVLECPNTVQGLSTAIGRWKGDDLEAAFEEHRLPGVYARSREEWLQHPQGALLEHLPVIEIEKIADSDPEPIRVGQRPLDMLRVLDLGHVIAGPVIARTLAEHGADVLRLNSPLIQDPFRQTVDTNIGKRSSFIDLNRAEDRAKTRALASAADVIVQSWRAGSMANHGLAPQDVAKIRPGVIYASVTAFGDTGPWQTRGGFEQLGQTVSGVAVSEAVDGKPRVVPTYLLNDYLTGYLGATGVMLALMRRAIEGGSYHVKVSLTRTSMWVQELGLRGDFDPSQPRRPFHEGLHPVLESRDSAYGELCQLPPVAQFSLTPAYWRLPPPPNGAHRPEWLHR